MTNDQVSKTLDSKSNEIIDLRRQFHATPELGFKESKTGRIISEYLMNLGLTVETGIGSTGIVGVLDTGPGPTLMIRADIDGLPIQENTELPFASKNGRMHACGHDGHITMALFAAKILAQLVDQISGKIVFVFQPAEEIVSGAKRMIDDGLLIKWPADRVIGTHLWNQLPTGMIGVNPGTVFASADQFQITVLGKGGHGALPHLSFDPIVAASQIINGAQTIISRELSPNEMGVITFGQIHGGTASNIIADSVFIEGTIRAYKNDVRTQLINSLQRLAQNTASAFRTSITFEHTTGTPPVINNTEVADWIADTAANIVGNTNVTEIEPISVGDDMAEFLNRVPGTYFILGAAKEESESHHNSKFDFDENCLRIGVELFVKSALDFLS